MIDILIYLRDPHLEPLVEELFSADYYSVKIVEQLPLFKEVTSDQIFDLLLIWPATEKNLRGLAESLKKQSLAYLPLVAVLDTKQDPAALSGFPLAEIVRLPIAKPEFHALLKTLIIRRQYQAANQHGIFWQGNISEYNLIDLLQMIEGGDADVDLRLSAGEHIGKVVFQQGQVANAELGRFSGFAALQRMTYWNSGVFSTHPLTSGKNPPGINEDFQQLLLKLLEQTTSMDQVLAGLPDIGTELLADKGVLLENPAPITKKILKITQKPATIVTIINSLQEEPLAILQSLAVLFEQKVIDLRQKVEISDRKVEQNNFSRMISSLRSFFPWKKNHSQPVAKYRFFDAGPETDEAVLEIRPTVITSDIAKTLQKCLKEYFN